MLLCCPLGTTRRFSYENNVIRNAYPGVLFPHNKSFIDQACSFKMARYWLRSFFCVLMVLDSVSAINRQKVKNELAWLILCHLDLQNLVNKPCLYQVHQTLMINFLHYCCEFKISTGSDSKSNPKNEIVWKNRKILVGKKTLFFTKLGMTLACITKISDILNQNQDFLKWHEFAIKFNLNVPFTTCLVNPKKMES